MSDRPILDLTNYHKKVVRGDITFFFTWVGESIFISRPCMVIIPTYRRASDIIPYVIPMENAWMYHEDVEGPKKLLETARKCAQTLGMDDSISNVHKLATVIHEHLDDLVMMPPQPIRESIVAADVLLTDRDSGKTVDREIIDHV